MDPKVGSPDPTVGRSRYFRAVVTDFDGTLTHDGHLGVEVVGAIDGARRAGVEVIVATGRILDELRATEPRVESLVRTIVAENGSVLLDDGVERSLAPPIDRRLDGLLERRGVRFRRGRVLLACSAADEQVVLAARLRGRRGVPAGAEPQRAHGPPGGHHQGHRGARGPHRARPLRSQPHRDRGRRERPVDVRGVRGRCRGTERGGLAPGAGRPRARTERRRRCRLPARR
jgi:hypothetical protein